MNADAEYCQGAAHLAASAPPWNPEKRWLSYAESAERLGVCERTIRREVDAGNLPKPYKIGRCLRFDWLEVVAALRARKESQVYGKD